MDTNDCPEVLNTSDAPDLVEILSQMILLCLMLPPFHLYMTIDVLRFEFDVDLIK
jgi:hypothetical protein